MCSTLYYFCADCNNFFPSNRKIKIKKRKCADETVCKNNKRMLLDHRHESCKPSKKKLCTTESQQETTLPVQETMFDKLQRIDEKRRGRKASKDDLVEALQATAITPVAEAATSTGSASSSTALLPKQKEVHIHEEKISSAALKRAARHFAFCEQDNEFWRGEDVDDDYWTGAGNPWGRHQRDMYFLPYEFLKDRSDVGKWTEGSVSGV